MKKISNPNPADQKLLDRVELNKSPHNQRIRIYLKSHGWFKILLPNLNPTYCWHHHPELFLSSEICQNKIDLSESKLKYDEMCPACGEIITRNLSTSPLNEEKICPACQLTYKNFNQIEEGDLP